MLRVVWPSRSPFCDTDRGRSQGGAASHGFPGGGDMLNRRHFLSHVAGAAALAVPGLKFIEGLRASAAEMKKQGKSLIILWMGGGPSHMDLWDLKPGSPNAGEFKPKKT